MPSFVLILEYESAKPNYFLRGVLYHLI